ncbi:MAG: CHAT domain-containing protein [Chloracidobacterium sp.]|nr:CHAT domain-containing protein [Chloracidobacterium sp.]
MFRNFLTVLLLFLLSFKFAGAQDTPEEVERLFKEADALRAARDAGTRRQAIEKLKELAPRFRALGLRKREADCLNSVGNLYKNLSDFNASLSFLEKGLEIYREIGERRGEFAALMNLGQSYRYLGKPGAADLVNQALALARQMENKELEAFALNELGVLFYTTAEIRASLEPLEQAAAIFRELGRKRQQASLLNNIGLIRRTLGEQEAALRLFREALQLFRAEQYRDGEADAALNLSAAYSDMFMAAEAIEYFDLALNLYRQAGNKQRESVVLNNIGVFYNGIGDDESARDYYQLSAEIADSIGNKRQVATAIKNLGTVSLNLGRPEHALELLNDALLIVRELKNRFEEATVLNAIGIVYERTGQFEKAEKPLMDALSIFREVKNRNGEANALYVLGLVREKTGKHAEASQFYTEAIQIRRELIMPGDEAPIMLGLARVARNEGDIPRAISMVEDAIAKIETLRTGLPGHELRTAFFSIGKEAYDLYIELLMQTASAGRADEKLAKAFESAERSRARSLLESVFESRSDIRSGIDADALERERRLQAALNARERYRMSLLSGRSSPEKISAVEQEIRILLDEYHQHRARLRSQNPQYTALTQPRTLSLSEVQKNLLDPNTVLLEYSIGDKASFVWVVTQRTITGHRLPEKEVIAAQVRRIYDSFADRNRFLPSESPRQRSERLARAAREFELASRSLGKMILPTGLGEFVGRRLAIVPDGPLHFVPFAALKFTVAAPAEGSLKGRESYLIETNEIVSLPSASTVAVLRNSRGRSTNDERRVVSVLADPIFNSDDVRFKAIAGSGNDPAAPTAATPTRLEHGRSKLRSDLSRLRFSRTEADSIASLVPAERRLTVLDFDANKSQVLSKNFTSSRILHFATHGLISTEYPELSGIVLSLLDKQGKPQDGFLRLHDIYNIRIDADIVVLSACDTALGKEFKGEGIVGLARGFMYAGASDVVASLWKVDDRATADLMKRFYQYLVKEELPPGQALRRAQLSLLRAGGTRDPFFWAAFTVQGDWK